MKSPTPPPVLPRASVEAEIRNGINDLIVYGLSRNLTMAQVENVMVWHLNTLGPRGERQREGE